MFRIASQCREGYPHPQAIRTGSFLWFGLLSPQALTPVECVPETYFELANTPSDILWSLNTDAPRGHRISTANISTQTTFIFPYL